MRLSYCLEVGQNYKISLDAAQNAIFYILQRGKYRFVYFENLYSAADAMRNGLVFTLWTGYRIYTCYS